jgi:hypothetical protein
VHGIRRIEGTSAIVFTQLADLADVKTKEEARCLTEGKVKIKFTLGQLRERGHGPQVVHVGFVTFFCGHFWGFRRRKPIS